MSTIRVVRLLLATALIASFLVSGSTALSVEHEEVSPLYFPWVPNGVVIDDPRGFDDTGPYYGRIMIQNPFNSQITVRYTPTANGEHTNAGSDGSFTLGGFESGYITPDDLLLLPGTGGGAIVWAERNSDDEPMPITGIVKQTSPQNMAPQMATTGDHEIVDGYPGLIMPHITNEILLPIVQTNNNWNTLIRVTNFTENSVSQSHLYLQTAGADEQLGPFVVPINPGNTVTFDLLDLGVPDGWVGSALILGGGDSKIGAVAERIKNETNMLMINPSRGRFAGQITETVDQYAPLIFRDWFNWNTGISLVNLANNENDVTIHYYAPDGDEVHADEITLDPLGMDFLYLPGGAGGDDAFVGSALIVSDHPVLGVIDEVKYLGDPTDGAGHAMSYLTERDYTSPGHYMALPLFQKGNAQSGNGDTSGIQLFNPTDEDVVYRQRFYDHDGALIPFATDTPPPLGPKESRTIYALDLGLIPDWHNGSVVFRVQSGGGLVAVMNNVNYEVQYDGSASFNFVRFEAPPMPPGPGDEMLLSVGR